MAKSVVGVDIGDATIRAVEVARTKGRPTLLRYHELALPEGAVSRGEVLQPNTVSSVLKQMWRTAGFKSKNVALGIGNQRVLARDFTMPRMSLRGIREALPFHVQDMLPVPVADALLDFYPVSEEVGEHGPVVNGILIAAVKEAVLANVNAAKMAGLTTVDVDLIPFVLSRVLVRRLNVPGTVALIDVGAHTTSVVVVKDGVPQFVRIIPAGGGDLTEALTTALEVELVEAEAIKCRLGLANRGTDVQEQRAAEIIHRIAGDLLNSLRTTMAYFGNTRLQDPVRQIVLTGGGARLTGFAEALTSLSRVPVTDVDPFSSVRLAPKIQGEDLRLHAGSLSVALGLALRGAA